MKIQLRNKRRLWILLVCMLGLLHALPAFAEHAAEPDVQFQKAEGTAEIVRAGCRVQQRYASMKLYNGDQIRTGEDGSAWIGARSGERLRLDAGSCLEIRTAYGMPEFLLESGNLYFHMEEQESSGLRIRTAAAALHAQDACGWMKVIDRNRIFVYLLSGTVQCGVTDPITGQTKQASFSGGQLAECAVIPGGRGDSWCGINVRDFTEEEIDGFVLKELAEDTALCGCIQETFGTELPAGEETVGKRLAAAETERSKHMERIRQESEGYAELRDPVWTGEAYPAYVMEDPDAADAQEEQPESAESSLKSGRSGSSGQSESAGVVPVIQVQVPPAGTASAEPQPSASSSKKKGSSGSPASDEKKPEQAPSPEPAGPTENQGLVVEGIVHNGPQGVIEVQEGGRVFVESGELFCNEGILASSGTIDGGVSNEGGEFHLTGGTVTGIVQKKGNTSLEGGTVNGSLEILGGELRMSGGMVPELTQNGGTLDLSGGVIKGGCEVKDGTFRMTGGTVADMTQNGGTLHLSGGTVNGSCMVEGGEFRLVGGAVPDMVQKKGSVSLESGTVSGSCTVEGGELRLSGGTVAQMIQKGGITDINGGIINTGCQVEGGELRVSGGTVPGLNQKGGVLAVNGGTVNGSCQVEGGTFRMTDGALTGIAQKEGTVRISGGTVTDGCTVEGGRLELSGGLLRAGSAAAALTVKTGGAMRFAGTPAVTAETADVHITGGSLAGDGADKYALYAESGTAMVADAANTQIRAQDAFRTVAGAKGGSWAVRYVEKGGGDYVMGADSFDNPGGSSVIYVTKKDTDGLMRLRRLSNDFLDVSRAEAGDTLTLCGDVTYQTAPAVLDMAGGTKEAPVVLDLNGRKLNLMDGNMQGGSRVQIRENAVWEIQGGQFSAWSVTGQDSGVVNLSDTTVTTSEFLSAEGESALMIRDSVIREGLAVRGFGTVEITDSEIDGRIETAQNGRMEITDCRITAPAGTPGHTYIKNTGNGTLRISGTEARPGEIQNTGSAVLTLTGASKVTVAGDLYNTGRIQVEDAELLSDGGEITNQGTMNLTGGTVARVVQKGGVLRMENGIITDGCTVTGGRFEMMNGKLEPGSADAALKVDCSGSETADQNGVPVTEENADVTITGGTVLGTGTKKAFDVYGGRVWISDDTVVKAKSAVNTITGDTGATPGSWGVRYAGYQMQPEKPPVLYVTRKEADGMMRLRRLEDDFEKAARAEDGDVITLSGDVTGVRSVEPGKAYSVVATGGKDTDPVILDLNGKRLREMSEVEDGGVDIVFQDAAVWKIENGEIQMMPETYGMILAVGNSSVSFSEFTAVCEGDYLGYWIMAENSTLNIDRSVFYGDVGMIKAWTNSFVTVTRSRFSQGASVEVGDGGVMDVSECQLDSWDLAVHNGRLNVSDCSIVSQYGIESENGVLNISKSSIEITEGNIRHNEAYKDVCIYNNGGEINLTDISLLTMPGDIQAVGGTTRISGADSGCELTASNIESSGDLYISGCSMENMGEITGNFDIFNCKLKDIRDITGYGNLTECSMENIDNIRWTLKLNLSRCTMKDIGQMSLYEDPNMSWRDNVNITECTIDGIKLDGTGSDVYITDCDMVDRAEINAGYNMYFENSNIKLEKAISEEGCLSIDGGSITCAETFLNDTGYMIGEWVLEVKGNAVLDPGQEGVVPIKGVGLDPRVIIGGNAKIVGGSSPALSFPMRCNSVKIEGNAELSSSCAEGTIVFFPNERHSSETGVYQFRDIYLEGGSVINTGQGCAVHWGDPEEHEEEFEPYPDFHGNIQTECRANIEEVFVKSDQAYIPDGYEIVENNGSYYLCILPEQLSLESQPDGLEADAALRTLPEEENAEDTEGEETDLTAEEEFLPDNSDSGEEGSESTESKEELKPGTESTEGEKDPEPESTEGEKDSESESAEGEKDPESEPTEDEKDPESESAEGEKDPEPEPTEDEKDPESESSESEAKPEETGRPSGESGSFESNVLPSADSDKEEKDASSAEPDSSGESGQPSEKDRRPEDAVLPSDGEETLKKEESEADQGSR